jgi:uncharacterized protein (DUF433 family)
MQPTISEHIEITPGICGGKPRIAGHRIRVQDVVVWHESMGMSPDDIVAQYPQLTLADVHAALAYYFDHVEEIREQMESGHQFAEELESKTVSKVAET